MGETNLPKVSVGVMVVKGDQVLLGRRRSGAYDGVYAFPGGQLEWFEEFVDCGKREIIEECGEQFMVSEPRFFYWHNFIDRDRQKHYLAVTLLAEWQAGEAAAVEPDKCFGWEWFKLDNLPTNILLNNHQAIQNYLKQIENKLQE